MNQKIPLKGSSFNLETTVGRKKDVFTSVVMGHFFIVPGAPRSLSEISDRDEGGLDFVGSFDRLRRIVGLFNENGEG